MVLAGLVIALGGGRRRRHHRRGEHRAAVASAPTGRRGRASTGSVILEASLEVRSPIVFATLIIVAAAIPVFLLQGLTGAFFRPLALSYTLAIVASMVVALTLTPGTDAHPAAQHPDRAARIAAGARPPALLHAALLARVVRRPRWTYAARGGRDRDGRPDRTHSRAVPFPHFKEPDFLIHWVTQPGTSDAEMERTTTEVSQALREIPGLRNFGAHIGQAFLGEEVAGVNLGENWVSVDPSVDYDETLEAIENLNDDYPGCSGRPDLPRRADRGGRQRAARSPSSSGSSGRTSPFCGRRPTRSTTSWPASTARWTTTSTSPPTCPAPGRGRSGHGPDTG